MRSVREFLVRVLERFPVGDPSTARITPLPDATNRLWRLDTPDRRYLVKELPFDTDPARMDVLAQAAAFERHVASTGSVSMPPVVPSVDDAAVERITGSRGQVVVLRVHAWLDGTQADARGLARSAGSVLHAIQDVGRAFSRRPSGRFSHFDDADPVAVHDDLLAEGILETRTARDDARTIAAGVDLVGRSHRVEGDWVFTHYDHKPENALVVDGGLAIIDWDEAAHCHPRLEAVESALRWCGIGRNVIDADAFRAFVAGYNEAGGDLRALTPEDFGKWIAAVVGWFSFTGRRALGQYDEDERERTAAAVMSRRALDGLAASLHSLDEWASFVTR